MTFKQLLESKQKDKSARGKNVLLAKVNNQIFDLSSNIPSDTKEAEITFLTYKDHEGKEVFYHSSAHVLAQAIKRLYPKVQLTIGPVIESGPGFFYYDIFLEEKITEENFSSIEKEMHQIVQEQFDIHRQEYTRTDAVKEFLSMGEEFKAKIIQDIPDNETLTVYKQGEFQDLCRGPHVNNTQQLGFFKITAVSGAYWKGDITQPMLQRIYAVSFPTEKELKQHLFQLEEAKKRDHRKLGKELQLFYFDENAPGMPFYLPKGTIIFEKLIEFIKKECTKRNYQEIKTPVILSDDLWVQSGHYENFKENMYFTHVEEKGFAIKPMNCPGCSLVYKSQLHSYKELPIRYSEFGLVHRHELSGVLHGLFRVRAFTQDDAHVFCTLEQLKQEIQEAINFCTYVYHYFDFKKIQIFVATKPEKALGDQAIWEKSTKALFQALEALGISYKIKEGEGAFYGPKIEFNIEDSLGRNWQCGTIQVDFSMPTRFDLNYIDSTGNKQVPVMLHRAILGSIERFMGILIEHYNGKLPLYLSPVQIKILTINEAQVKYAENIYQKMLNSHLRVELDIRNEKIGYKIREWNQQKINYAVILGKNEEAAQVISIRKRETKLTEEKILDNFIQEIKHEISY